MRSSHARSAPTIDVNVGSALAIVPYSILVIILQCGNVKSEVVLESVPHKRTQVLVTLCGSER
jgi:hypothetical protein